MEIALAIGLMAIVMAMISQSLLAGLDTFNFVSGRQQMLNDTRYALNRISNELLQIKTEDLITLENDKIEFVDHDGLTASFEESLYNGINALYRDNELLLTSIQSFQIKYLDSFGIETADLNSVRQFNVTLVAQGDATQGDLTLTTTVVPRNFIYSNYE